MLWEELVQLQLFLEQDWQAKYSMIQSLFEY